MKKEAGLYLHIPFCAQKCAYCDFASWADKNDRMEAYARKVCQDIENTCAENVVIRTVFVGGGTPSVLPPKLMEQILTAVDRHFKILPHAEMSCEMNPGTVTEDFLRVLKEHQFNRVSMGMQAAQERLLKMLGRIHTMADVQKSVDMVRKHGFNNLNLDLMMGLPFQTEADAEQTLDAALALGSQHMSCYGLIVEENTPLEQKVQKGEWPLPDTESERRMYELCREKLAAHGYSQYEISNFAKPGFACRHNVDTWKRGEYIGIGCAACGFMDNVRYANPRDLDGYIRGDKREEILISPEDARFESVMLGLRLTEGIREADFESMHGMTFREAFGNKMDKPIKNGLLTLENGVMKLTRRGMDVQNSVLVDLM